jgi:hypothetical protein
MSEVCRCGHGVAMHDLNRKGERTACFVMLGPKGIRCMCKEFRTEKPDGPAE